MGTEKSNDFLDGAPTVDGKRTVEGRKTTLSQS